MNFVLSCKYDYVPFFSPLPFVKADDVDTCLFKKFSSGAGFGAALPVNSFEFDFTVCKLDNGYEVHSLRGYTCYGRDIKKCMSTYACYGS